MPYETKCRVCGVDFGFAGGIMPYQTTNPPIPGKNTPYFIPMCDKHLAETEEARIVYFRNMGWKE